MGDFLEISRLVGRWEVPEISEAGLRTLHAKVDAVSVWRLERVALALSGLAAVLTVGTALWSSQSSQPPTLALWEQVAIAPAEYASAGSSASTQDVSMARWVVADLSSGGAQ